jgi:hypothetical protein
MAATGSPDNGQTQRIEIHSLGRQLSWLPSEQDADREIEINGHDLNGEKCKRCQKIKRR